MKVELSVEILKSAELVWPVLADVERWHEWTASIRKIERLDREAFGLGSRLRIRQPKLRAMIWRVSEFEPGRSIIWETQSTGILMIARHTIQPHQDSCIVTLTIDSKGWLSPLLEPFLIGITQRYVQMEAQGLKKKCEELTLAARS
jgi:hypothetical protein